MSIDIEEMRIDDYDEVLRLWRASEGVSLQAADSREGIERYLARNPGMCFTAREDGRVVGAVLSGHDGRRGYLHHLAVATEARGRGIASELVRRCREALLAEGIDRCHLFLLRSNTEGATFWLNRGWRTRTEIALMTRDLEPMDADISGIER